MWRYGIDKAYVRSYSFNNEVGSPVVHPEMYMPKFHKGPDTGFRIFMVNIVNAISTMVDD